MQNEAKIIISFLYPNNYSNLGLVKSLPPPLQKPTSDSVKKFNCKSAEVSSAVVLTLYITPGTSLRMKPKKM